MEQPFIQEWEGGSWTGPSIPHRICLKFALQLQVILFKYIQEMKKNQPKTNKQKRESKHKKAMGLFFYFYKTHENSLV